MVSEIAESPGSRHATSRWADLLSPLLERGVLSVLRARFSCRIRVHAPPTRPPASRARSCPMSSARIHARVVVCALAQTHMQARLAKREAGRLLQSVIVKTHITVR
ncbi:hypothetical protein SCP_0313420 [Sparassis crispa]|uniref:Uncharacterized protein n=1 Tax=Sparassis crispa TaxID=139825 RepID=A0A401GHL8_9APHY|nr:hypothetical protein SCP_0313420 [Sparassis crispa]GBE81613.1 hypothetical protein SCP_0313420 [Sparassis crispa]